ncbi:MAG: ABC transporter ATP-binding protein [Chloroflexi bacterium]|nr:ABC transporter ATP-binding protein [Chloroflexota bacterium]
MLGTILAITGLSLVPPLLYRALIDLALPARDLALLNLLALGMIAIPILNGLVGVYQRYLSASIGEGIIFDLRCALFEHLQRMSLRFFTHTKTGELMARLNNDVVGAQQAVSSTAVALVSNLVAVVGTLAVMLSLDWRLTIASVLILPLFILPARRVGRVLRRITRDSFRLNAQMNALMNETLNVSGALLVKLFGRTTDETRRFAQRAGRVRDIGIRQALIGRWFFLGLGLVSAVGTAVVFWIGGWLVLHEGLTVGTIVAFSAYLTQLYGPLSALTNARVEFATSLVSFERVFEVLDLPREVTDRPGAAALRDVRGRVRFEDVWFTYEDPQRQVGLTEVSRWHWPGSTTLADGGAGRRSPTARADDDGASLPAAADGGDGVGAPATAEGGAAQDQPDGNGAVPAMERRWALAGISFAVEPGQLAALVGPSGAGKTTVTYLLPRLYDPSDGRITIDGHDLRDATLDSLAAHIGMVTQETYLFHDTIRTNLLYAKPDASDAELEAACRVANLHDFIASLPEGYETIVGERGYRLSGGEKQRLAIARVVLKDPCILVLDEATSHLDSESEALIQAALERVMRVRTSLVIAHRLSTVLAADVILVLDQGRLVERGTHAELLAHGGLYARLFETQFRPAKVAPLD